MAFDPRVQMAMSRGFKILIGTLGLLAVCTLLQQGPLFLGLMTRYPATFVLDASHRYVADISGIPKGKYFLSVGKVLGETQVRMNGSLLQQSRLIAGMPIDVSDEQPQRRLSIESIAKEEWRERLFDVPIVANYGIGLMIQEWRIFNGIFMGPAFSLLLVLMALFNLRLSRESANQIMPHLICGVAGVFYGLYLSGIPDLFFDPTTNTVVQIEFRVLLSAALIFLIDTYSGEKHRRLFILHVICVLLVVAICFIRRPWLTNLYELEIAFFGAATLVASIALLKVKKATSEVDLMICLGLSWTIFQFFGVMSHYFISASNMTVWSPSFIAMLAAANFYFIYKKAVSRSAEAQISKQQYYIAAQIAHDIRSPLVSLNAVIHSSKDLDESTRNQIRSVVTRIRGIANNLLKQSEDNVASEVKGGIQELQVNQSECLSHSLEPKTVELLVPILASLVSEKKLQFSGRKEIEIFLTEEDDEFQCIASIQRVEFGRLVSNLINNSVEAIKVSGRVSINIQAKADRIQISVEDNGAGMPLEVMAQVGRRGFSYGKESGESGSGLGVYHAMETVRSWGGELKYESEVGKGTKAIIALPKSAAPDWFATEIAIALPATVIVLDDDRAVHEYWSKRLSTFQVEKIHLLCFYTAKDMIQWFRNALGEVEHPFYLCDYDLADSVHTGLDVIEMLGIAANAVLVTNRWDDPEIKARCEKSRIKLLPKALDVKINII